MYQPVIGLEVHVQLDTQTKLFCGCPIIDGAPPNTAVCPVCLGHPGTLPAINAGAVKLALRAAVAVSCTVNPASVFARKQYFYPDLPKGYQISQYDRPLASAGMVHAVVEGESEARSWRIHRIHMEEDAGKSIHSERGTLLDFNRAGTPLVEIVSEADFRSGAEAVAYLKALHTTMIEAGVTHGDMEKGQFRCDANVSVHKAGEPWGTRAEVKNVNSFRFVAKAIDFEIKRQTALLESGGTVVLETRQWRDNRTVSMRSKEEASDYRYFPEPDLKPLDIGPHEIEEAVGALPGVPLDRWLLDRASHRRDAFQSKYGLDDYPTTVLLAHQGATELFEAAVAAGGESRAMSNWIQGEVMRRLNDGGTLAECGLTGASLVELQSLVDAGNISHSIAKAVFASVWESGGHPAAIVEEQGLASVGDDGLIREIVQKTMAENPRQVEKFKSGNQGLVGFFIGQVMRSTGGQAEPGLTRKIVVEELSG